MKKVTVIIKWVSHYRLPFYELLKSKLELCDIELNLIYGEPLSLADRRKKDWVDIPWGIKVDNLPIVDDKLIWQPVFAQIKNSDLVIVEHANKLLINYVLQFRRLFSAQKIAFWGHGRNFQSGDSFLSRLKEKWKRFLMFRVDWWFAYNSLCADEIVFKGVPKNQITSVENAVDTQELIALNAEVTCQETDFFKETYQIKGSNIAVFCGGMFNEKRLPFLLDSVLEVKQKVPDFEMIFIGGGLDQKYVEEASKVHSWIHYTGPLFGKEKVVAMTVANAYLMPGLVGLGILDAFALGLPVIITDYQFHSPEVSYVKDGVNGLIVKNNKKYYVKAISEVFTNTILMKELKKGCDIASKQYTIENMAKNFSEGVLQCLNNKR